MIEHYCCCINDKCRAVGVGLCLEFKQVEKHIPCVECGKALFITGTSEELVWDVRA